MIEDENVISVSDEDGNEFDLTILDEAIMDNVRYLALTEESNPDEVENLDVIILKEITDPATGENMLSTVDSDDELARIYEIFEAHMFDDSEDEEDEEEDDEEE